MEYTAGAAARAVGISVASVRGYSARFAQFLSPTASPGPGKPRVLTDDDLRVMRFVFYYTGQGESWDDVAARLARGEVAAFDWTPTPAATFIRISRTGETYKSCSVRLDAHAGRDITNRNNCSQNQHVAAFDWTPTPAATSEAAQESMALW